MNNIPAFNAETYAAETRAAGNAWRNAEGKGDNFARVALAALVTDALSPLALAISVYDEMKPMTAKGKPAAPKEADNGTISISSLRSAKGGEGARSVLAALFYVAANAGQDNEAVAAFIRGDRKAFRLFPLKAHLAKVKADAAKAEKEEKLPSEPEAKREGDETPTDTVSNPIVDAIAFIAGMDGEALTANADAIAALLTACREASDRLAAAETLRTGTEG